jgi:hypothetical protein
VVAKNQGRREITICNDHATQIAYLAFPTDDSTPTAALNAGIRLNAAGGSWTSNVWDGPGVRDRDRRRHCPHSF